MQKYTFDIRPTLVEELDKTLAYIETELENPQPASRLLSDVYAAIDETIDHPTVTRPVYRPPHVAKRRKEIYVSNVIDVGNLVIRHFPFTMCLRFRTCPRMEMAG